LKIVATYPVDPGAATAGGGTAPTAAPGGVDAPRIPVAPAAAHHALAGVTPLDAPDAPGGAAPGATPDDGIRPHR
jgi:hypothetical protein